MLTDMIYEALLLIQIPKWCERRKVETGAKYAKPAFLAPDPCQNMLNKQGEKGEVQELSSRYSTYFNNFASPCPMLSSQLPYHLSYFINLFNSKSRDIISLRPSSC